MDLSSMSDSDLQAIAGQGLPSQGALASISQGILGQESGNNPNIRPSIDGAIGQAQIMPGTFAQYARPGEDINNPADNLAVHGRILQDLSQKAGGDPARIAVGYFSGAGNIAPPDSPTPWKNDRTDGNGKSVSSYVSDVMGRVGNAMVPAANANEMPSPDLSHMSDEQLTQIAGGQSDPSGLGSQPWSALHVMSQQLPQIGQPEQTTDNTPFIQNPSWAKFGGAALAALKDTGNDMLSSISTPGAIILGNKKPEWGDALSLLMPFIPMAPEAGALKSIAKDGLSSLGEKPPFVRSALETDVSKIDPNTPLSQYANLGFKAGNDAVQSSPEIAAQVQQLKTVTQKISQLEKVGSQDAAGVAQLNNLKAQADDLRASLGVVAKEPPPTVAAAASGGVEPPVVGAAAVAPKEAPAIPQTSEEMGKLANASYKAAEDAGGTISPQGTNKLVSIAEEVSQQSKEGAYINGTNPAIEMAQRYKSLKDKPLTLPLAQELDEGLSNTIEKMSTLGKPDKEALPLLKIQATLRDLMHNPAEGDVAGSKAGFDALAQGRQYWMQMMKMRDLERIQANAALMDVPATSIRSGVRAILKSPAKLKYYSPSEISDLKKAAKAGILGEALRGIGSRLTQYAAGGAGFAAGGPISGMAAGAAAHFVSGAARDAAETLQASRLQNAIKGVAKNTTPKPRK